jgi:uncharacterized protein YbaR (Trm112 family)/SAM-dependent methyltransferase
VANQVITSRNYSQETWTSQGIDCRLLSLLACPQDHSELWIEGRHLCCATGHKYPIVDGIPVFLLSDKEQTIEIASASLKAADGATGGPLYLETLGVSEDKRRRIERDWLAGSEVDPAISYLIGATSGCGYVNLIGKLTRYPIPDIPLDYGNGELLVDIGSNWGRWSVSAARKGWRVIAIDPSLGAIMASQRAFSGMGLDISYICGDARFLPFKADTFRCAFSYSVIQHFSEGDAQLALAEVGRVLCRNGFSKIQMAHKGGVRSTYHRTRLAYKTAGIFRVRYWSLATMLDIFEKTIGPSKLIAEAFGGLGLLNEDRDYVSAKAKLLILVSHYMKKLSSFVPSIIRLADSVYVVSTKRLH